MRYIFFFLSIFIAITNTNAYNHEDEMGKNPFILIARVHVKDGMVDQYFNIADQVDNAVEASEPGMLFHNFDANPDDALAFTWTELYANSDAFIAHDANPPVQDYVAKHMELGDGFSIEIYGNVSGEVIEAIGRLGVPFKHFKTTSIGYIREDFFK